MCFRRILKLSIIYISYKIKIFSMKFIIIVVLGLILSVSTFLLFDNNKIYASQQQQQQQVFTAFLLGQQVVPPVDTPGTGSATFEKETNTISYRLNVLNVCDIANIQMHYGERGEEGPLIANLYQSKNDLNLFNNNNNNNDLFDSKDGILDSNNDLIQDISSVQKSCNFTYSGGIDESALQGQFKDQTINELNNAMANNNTYVVVNSEQHPDGEIRGQILSKVPN